VRRIPASLLMISFISACNAEGPRDGAIFGSPNATVVKAETETATATNERYAVIEVNKSVAASVSRRLISENRKSFFSDSPARAVVIGPGDTLGISIVSSNSTGFVDYSGNSLNPISTASLPSQEVSSDGTVSVPPLGRLLAKGKTIQSFEEFASKQLGEVLVDPTVIVQLIERKSARVTVTGKVGAPGTVPLSTTESRLIDMITAAGGPAIRSGDLEVTLVRGGRRATITMDQLYNNPAYNIAALPGDMISIESPSRQITVLGAFASNSTFDFDKGSASLADAMGRIGGLINNRAKLKGVYLYRETPRSTLVELGADVSGFSTAVVPTIYSFDFTEPTVFFTAKAFELADGDILYTSESVLSEVNSLIAALSPWIGSPSQFISEN